MNIIDSFFVALGYKVDTSGITEMRQKVDEARSSILSWGTAITALISGAALKKVAEIGSKFEQNRIQIAGFLSALELSPDFNTGLEDAARIIQKITIDAAKLPGEAEEYVEVFKANAAFLKNAMPGANADQMADFTNRLTAVAKTVASTLDATQIARESSQLLAAQGRAGGHNVLWQKLMPFLMQVEGQANITAQSFNAMTQVKRVEVLNAAFAKLQPMLDASADSFDAMWGAAVSATKQLVRMGTSGLFSGMKRQLKEFTSAFVDDDGKLTERGNELVATLGTLGTVIGTLLRDGAQFTVWFLDLSKNSLAFKIVLAGLLALLAGSAWEKAISSVTKLAKGIRSSTLLTGFFAIALALVAEDIWGFFHGADSVTGMLVEKLGPGIAAVAAALAILAAAFVSTQVAAVASAFGFTLAWSAAFLPILLAIAAVAALGLAAYELQKHWDEVLGWLETKLNGLIDLLNTVREKTGMVGEILTMGLLKERTHFNFAPNQESTLPAGDGVLAAPFGPQPGGSMWDPGFNMATAGAGGASVTHGDVHIDKIEIKSTDPVGAGREVARQVRTAQSGLVR